MHTDSLYYIAVQLLALPTILTMYLVRTSSPCPCSSMRCQWRECSWQVSKPRSWGGRAGGHIYGS